MSLRVTEYYILPGLAKIIKLPHDLDQQNLVQAREVRRERKYTKNPKSLHGNPVVAIWETSIWSFLAQEREGISFYCCASFARK
jgi:hypothetical protein